MIRNRRQDMASRSHSASNFRRRRLLLLEAGSYVTASASEPLSPYDETPEPTFIHAYVSPEASETDVSIDRTFSAKELDLPRTIPHLVSSPVPVSWLFVGDSFTPKDVTEPRPWRVYTNRFAGVVRAHFQRPKDVFIDATFPSARLSEVLFDFERRIAKFEPDICFVSLSITEADTKSVDRFEKLLVRLIRWSKDFHCQLVVQTPPCLPSRTEAELTRRLILIETIRGIATEHSTPLVDHWEHWEWATSQIGQTEEWFDSETHTPAEQGHRQLAKRLVQDLKLNDIPKPEFPVAMKDSVVLGG
jgi:hypothetical protein